MPTTATAAATTPRKPRKTATSRPIVAVVPETPPFPLMDRGRAIRSVTFALGPVTFLGGVHGAVADQTDPVVTLCRKDGHAPARIKRTDSCSVCGNEDKATFIKGQVVGDEVTVLDPEAYAAIKDADEAFTKSIQLRTMKADDRFMVPMGGLYYVSAKGAAATAYSLIAAIVRSRPDVAFLGELSFGGAPRLYRVEVTNQGVLALRELARPEAIREQPQVAGPPVDATALGFLEQLVDASTEVFDPTAFANPHAVKVEALLRSATPAGTAAAPAASAGGDDILAKLRESVAAIGKPAAVKPARRTRTAKPDAA